MPGYAQGVELVGDLAYVADYHRGLRIIDVSNPAFPVELGGLRTPGYAVDVEVVDGLAYLAEYRSGLRIIDVSNPAFPVELGALETPWRAIGVDVVGDLAYVTGIPALQIIDVSNPALPVELSILYAAGEGNDVEVVDDLAYVAAGRSGLRIIDVSNPTSPVALGLLHTPGDAYDVEVVGDLAYVADYESGLRIIDVSNPAFPVELGALVTPDNAYDVEVVGGLAYVAGHRSGLRIIDFGPEYLSEIPIEIDIKPDSNPNSINPDDGGVVPVALLGSDAFDVSEVDAATLKFGPGGAAPDHAHGPHLEDVNADGLPDLLAHFDTGESGIVFGTLVACVEGVVLDGKPFNGCDAVRTVPDMDGDALLDVEEAAIGTDALNPDTDGDGFDDGQEVLLMGTDPLDPLDPTPNPVPEPASWLMLVAGAVFLALLYRQRARELRFG